MNPALIATLVTEAKRLSALFPVPLQVSLVAQTTELATGEPVWVQFVARVLKTDGTPVMLASPSFAALVGAVETTALAVHEHARSGGVLTPEAARLIAQVMPFVADQSAADAAYPPNG